MKQPQKQAWRHKFARFWAALWRASSCCNCPKAAGHLWKIPIKQRARSISWDEMSTSLTLVQREYRKKLGHYATRHGDKVARRWSFWNFWEFHLRTTLSQGRIALRPSFLRCSLSKSVDELDNPYRPTDQAFCSCEYSITQQALPDNRKKKMPPNRLMQLRKFMSFFMLQRRLFQKIWCRTCAKQSGEVLQTWNRKNYDGPVKTSQAIKKTIRPPPNWDTLRINYLLLTESCEILLISEKLPQAEALDQMMASHLPVTRQRWKEDPV